MRYNFHGIYISWISISQVLHLNLQMAVVLCIFIDVYIFADETFVDGCLSAINANMKPCHN